MTDASPSLTPTTRADALAGIARQQAIWDDLVARIGPDRINQPGPMGAWTFKDLAGHLAVWEHHENARLAAAANGEPAPAPLWPEDLVGDDPINAWIQGRTATRPAATVLAEARAVFDQLAELVRQLPESHLNSPASIPWAEGYALGPALVSGDWYSHFNEHVGEVDAWLASAAPAS